MGYFISRQRDFKDNTLYIEIAVGKKNAGIDVLTLRYPGEQKNLVDPRDAVNIAENIVKRWERDYGDEKKMLRIVGMPQPLVYDTSAKGIAAAKVWASKVFNSMTKCAACTKAMGNRDPYQHEDLVNLAFCTEYCCAKKYKDTYGIEPKKIVSKKEKLTKKK